MQALPALPCPLGTPASSHPGPPRPRRRSPFLPPRLLGEPVVEHGPREADVPSYSMAGQAASPNGLVDPARLDVQIPGGLLWAPEPILCQSGPWLCCRWRSLHTPTDPQRLEPANRFWSPRHGAGTRRPSASNGSSREPPRPRDAPWGNQWGNQDAPSAGPGTLKTAWLDLFWQCRRRDSNPRHADYDSAALTS